MKAILRSVQPQWMAKILTGEKTVEIGKTMPRCDLPVEVYLYCTDARSMLFRYPDKSYRFHAKSDYGIGYSNENFIHSKTYNDRGTPCLNRKIAAKFTLSNVSPVTIGRVYTDTSERLAQVACLTINEVLDYANGRDTYAWHISDLVVFDKPMELGEFYKPCDVGCLGECHLCIRENLTRPPQSWQYVEVKE